jgi:hypothetical protein
VANASTEEKALKDQEKVVKQQLEADKKQVKDQAAADKKVCLSNLPSH